MRRLLFISNDHAPFANLIDALRDKLAAAVETAASSGAAAQKMPLQHYDAIIAATGDADVAERAAHIRAHDPAVPVIMLCNHAETAGAAALHAGADYCFNRDVPPPLLAAYIARALQRREHPAFCRLPGVLRSDLLFELFMDHVPGAVWIKDADGRYLYGNQLAEHYWHQPRNAVYGKRDDEFLPPELARQYMHSDQLAIANKTVQTTEQVPLPDGSHSFLLNKFTILDENGKVAMIAGVAVDISARVHAEKALAESNERLFFAMKAAHMISWEWDVVRGIVSCADGTLSEPPYSGPAKLFCERVHPDDRERVHRTVQDALERLAQYALEYRVIMPGGEMHWISDQATIQRDVQGNAVRVTGIAVEITERKRAEDALRESEARFRKLAAQLEESARQKDDFLAMLAHELRNPLAPLRNGLHVLQMPQASPDHARKAKEMMSRQLTQLSSLIDDLLDVSRISRGKILLHMERLDLVAVMRASVEDQRADLEARGLRVSFESGAEPLWVDGDRTRLAQIVGNLLSNAAKFTDAGGSVAVQIHYEPEGFACVMVRDTGIGVAPEFVARLFEPFHQADQSLARSHGGLGLGLAVVKGLVQLHGGTVRAESAGSGMGASFSFRIPAIRSALSAVHEQETRGPGSAHRILIIEDNPDTEESLKMLLQLEGHDVLSARTGLQGIELAEREQPEVVLCDIGLPDIDGYAVARRLRATTHSQLIAVSGYGQSEDKKRALDAGFHQHLTKPLDPEKLNAVLDALAPQPALH